MTRRTTVAAAFFLVAAVVFAQKPGAPPAVNADSFQTRADLQSVLRRYPPQLGAVLKLDPTLLGNATYLANYPELAAFAVQHPEVAHNPGFFFENVSGGNSNAGRLVNDVMSSAGAFLAFLVVVAVFIWVLKALIEHRRWSRAMEINIKVLDRFASSEELLAYIQTPPGKRFLESAPLPLENAPRPISAPIGRMFWSLQIGLVAIGVGIGMDLVSLRVATEAAQVLYGFGVISLLVGIAFVVSAVVFYVLSRRFGLFETPAVRDAQ